MPYIRKEEVQAIRAAIKAACPEYKFSITMRHHSSVDVCIMAGPMDFSFMENGRSVNHFWYKEHFADRPEVVALFDKIMNAMNTAKDCHTVSEDGDYGSIPNYYQSLSVGKWDKPYQMAA